MKDFCTFCGVYEGCAKLILTCTKKHTKLILYPFIESKFCQPYIVSNKKNRTLVLIIILNLNVNI